MKNKVTIFKSDTPQTIYLLGQGLDGSAPTFSISDDYLTFGLLLDNKELEGFDIYTYIDEDKVINFNTEGGLEVHTEESLDSLTRNYIKSGKYPYDTGCEFLKIENFVGELYISFYDRKNLMFRKPLLIEDILHNNGLETIGTDGHLIISSDSVIKNYSVASLDFEYED